MERTLRSRSGISRGVASPGTRNQSTSTRQATTSRPPKGKRKQPPDSRQFPKSKKANTATKSSLTSRSDEAASESLASAHHGATRGRPMCFRIAGIPADWGRIQLEEKLAEIDPDWKLQNVQLLIFPACGSSAQTKTALLRPDSNTAYFEGWKQSEERHVRISKLDKKVGLNIDKHFYGLTPLNDPDEPITADIIAITGLAGHAFGSWQNRETRAMWLYDFLPEHFKSARIMTKSFMGELRNARVGCPKRPIIFIGHSLGGILIAQTMLHSFLQSGHDDIYGSVRGIFFFGTPHRGLNVDDLKAMMTMQQADMDNHELPQLLDQLNKDSEFLENQREACVTMWNKFTGKICSFYEREKTETVVSVGFP
ncbi:hypothetical protein FN846DRAFT_459530 [Sphaerosporella brunnea]|uniref:Alpha/Beta hydrolase protein n=1 Tax=Sphaerosporella brunnea TaxID=1250544 RepID=A0A5J5EE88_9PEZI|nr:hypothetical protein FN846DRAFT_459530 [Sphaerosporella brunnea]